ncbi:MAG TPA: helix-turn-helix domain-containing protein [Pseudonocardia sp.]|jgi:DNA-binding transcriptional ArsR family regulator
MREGDPDQRLAELESRVAALEAAGAVAGGAAPAAGPPAEAVAERSADAPGERPDGAGEVGYDGLATLHGEVRWTIRYTPGGVLELDEAPGAAVLAALGHPVRLRMVRRLLTGPATAPQLQEAAELSSTGQLYHHLRALGSARVVEQDGQRRYRVPATGVVPLLVLLLASADVAGQLRPGG